MFSKPEQNPAMPLEQALAAELQSMYGVETAGGGGDWPSVERVQREHFDQETSALCLSGGGVRSAAFSLGVAQGLAKRGLLKRFQYLSTVSGGGYTGSFLSAWAYRAQGGIAEVERELAAARPAPPSRVDAPEEPVWWVRRYSNYLTPRFGFTSLDTWTLIATYLRNLLLNWLVVGPLLGAAICIPFILREIVRIGSPEYTTVLLGSGVVLTIIALFLLRWRTYSTGTLGLEGRFLRCELLVTWLLWIGAFLATVGQHATETGGGFLSILTQLGMVWITVVVSTGLGVIFIAADLAHRRKRWLRDRLFLLIAFVVASALTAAAVIGWFLLFQAAEAASEDGRHYIASVALMYATLLTIFGPPMWILLLALGEVVFVGIAGSLSDDHDREWWARTAALQLRACAAWIIASALVLLVPPEVKQFVDETRPELPLLLASFAATVGGLLTRSLFRRAMTTTEGDRPPANVATRRRWSELALNSACIVLIAILLGVIAYYVHQAIDLIADAYGDGADAAKKYRLAAAVTLAASLYLLCAGFGLAVHVNRFSLHAMYRDRLIRTFLGASRWKRTVPPELNLGTSRKPPSQGILARASAAVSGAAFALLRKMRLAHHKDDAESRIDDLEVRQFRTRGPDPFTDFDRHDNPQFHWLLPQRREGCHIQGSSPDPAEGRYVKAPFLVINCALNMVGDRDLFLQERKATSFTFTTLHAGCERTGFRPVATYGGPGGVTLGTAMTISGAAVSPNAGYHSTPAITFLMTIFNARLGWWLGNPERYHPSLKSGPSQSYVPLLREMLGRTHSAGNWVFLSDGGHFENLGIYEMVRRGCRYIVAVDGSADPMRTFDDLGNALRKIRVDLGVEITQNQAFQIGMPKLADQGRYVALFDVHYPWSKGLPGKLLYLKTSIYDGNPLAAPRDVVEYSSRAPAFPHEPTSDQFFKESQFESYRALGEHEITRVIGQRAKDLPWLFTAAVRHIRVPVNERVESSR